MEKLRSTLPDLIPSKDKELVRMLRAARHTQRYPATDTKRGRPAKWKREELLRVAARLGDILGRETSSHISFASFVDHYLRLPDFPADVIEVLENGDINLFEAEQLARVTTNRLEVTPGQAKRTRAELLASHLQTRASGSGLQQRVNELLRASAAETGEGSDGELASEFEDLEDFDPYDSTHLFWEQLKQLGFAFREIKREDVTDEEIEELLKASEPILAILSRIQRRKEQSKVIKVRL
jgi:glycine/D-amino acid oxidase-like deaminating enzyme